MEAGPPYPSNITEGNATCVVRLASPLISILSMTLSSSERMKWNEGVLNFLQKCVCHKNICLSPIAQYC